MRLLSGGRSGAAGPAHVAAARAANAASQGCLATERELENRLEPVDGGLDLFGHDAEQSARSRTGRRSMPDKPIGMAMIGFAT
jgi:hypothetical protein